MYIYYLSRKRNVYGQYLPQWTMAQAKYVAVRFLTGARWRSAILEIAFNSCQLYSWKAEGPSVDTWLFSLADVLGVSVYGVGWRDK